MKLKLLCSILLFSFIGKVLAQNYPVQVTPQFLTPSPIYLSNYANSTTINSPLRVQLLLNDITLNNREVRLKIYIQGTGINLQGSDLVIGAESIYLDGGVPLTLTNELAPYYELKNMQGINPANYADPLPEGSYQFCFEVYDAFTGNKLSNKNCASTLIFQNDPPFLNMPFKNEEISVNNPQNIVFQWTPRHINVSNVEYELSIVEIWDHYVDPQAAFFSMPPIFQVTTRNTSYLMGPSDPPLLPNKKYAWRVKAKALQGADEIGLFKNQGYSEIYWFNHTQPCEAPPGLYAELKGASKVNIFWEPNPEAYKSYTIAYREAGDTESDWYIKTTNSDWVTIWDLKPGTTYEYMVKGICELGESEYSESQTITTELLDNSDSFYSCGLVPDEIAISNREPLPTLIPGDEIYAGDFVVTVTDVSGSNGIYSGRGYVKIPYLNLITLGVTFNGILVNTAHQLAEGEIVTLYDPAFGEGAEMTVDVSLNFSNASTLDYEDIHVDGEIQSVVVNSEGNIVVQTTSGPVTINTQGESSSGGGLAVEPGTPVKIKDDAGNEYTVVDGVVSQGGGESITNENSNELTGAGKALVTFEKAPQSKYGLDVYKKEYESTKLKRFYPEVEAGEKNYFVSWKALASGKMEPLLAKIEVKDNGLDLNKISFETNTGVKYTSQGGTTAEERTVQLAGKGNMQEEELYALYPTDSTALTLGRINTVSYDEVRHKVVVVPIGTNKYPGSAAELQNGLNTIYSQAAVTWEVEVLQTPLGVTYNSPLIVGEKGNNYIRSLKEIINAYKRTKPVNKNTYYLFLTDKLQNESGKDVEGYMLRGGQYGFIAVNSRNIIKTIAHELGHGAFHLKHAFSKYNVSETSGNLMSYSNGLELVKDQWDDIHNPALIIGLLESDEDGEAVAILDLIELDEYNDDQVSVEYNSVVLGDGTAVKTDDLQDILWAKNHIYLGRFTYNSVKYVAIGPNGKTFSRYVEQEALDKLKEKGAVIFNANELQSFDIESLKKATINDIVYTKFQDKSCIYEYIWNFQEGSLYTGLPENAILVSAEGQDCNEITYESLCQLGKDYFDQYKDIIATHDEKTYLLKISEWICLEDIEDLMLAQKSQYEKYMSRAKTISELFSQKSFSFKAYYEALQSLKIWIEKGSELLTSDKRELIFEYTYALHTDVLSQLSIDTKLKMLQIMLNGDLDKVFSINHHDMITKLTQAIKDDEAEEFFVGLESETYYFDKAPLIYHFKEKLDDFFTDTDAYTTFFKELGRLSDARYEASGGEIEVKGNLSWDVENKDYVLISLVKNKSDFSYSYDDSSHTVHIKTCTSCCSNTRGCNQGQRKHENILEAGSSPFSLVGITIVNDISPLTNNCTTVNGEEIELCGKMLVVPAIFIDYLEENVENQRWENFGWNTFNVVITVVTLGEGGAAIVAIRTANTGRKVAVAFKNGYKLLDAGYTASTIALQGTGLELPQWWINIGYLFTVKGVYDLSENGIRGLAALKYAKQNNNLPKVIDDLGLKKTTNGNEVDMTVEELEKVIDEFEAIVSKKGLDDDYKKALDDLRHGLQKVFSKDELLSICVKNPENCGNIIHIKDFVSNNLDDLLTSENRKVIWELTNEANGQFRRGDLIEEIFAQWSNKYGGYQNLNDIIPNYKTLDFDGVLADVDEVVSLKTFKPARNTTLSNFKTTLRSYVRKLSEATLDATHNSKQRVLDFVIEKDIWDNDFETILDYIDDLTDVGTGEFKNVEVRITEF